MKKEEESSEASESPDVDEETGTEEEEEEEEGDKSIINTTTTATTSFNSQDGELNAQFSNLFISDAEDGRHISFSSDQEAFLHHSFIDRKINSLPLMASNKSPLQFSLPIQTEELFERSSRLFKAPNFCKIDKICEYRSPNHYHQIWKGVQTFNEKPSAGIDYLMKEGVVTTAEDVACFFHECVLLDRKQIGDYISLEGSFPSQVLEEFLRKIDLSFLEFDLALRRVLYCFRLPGESQKIDRIITKFGAYFFDVISQSQINENFATADTVYYLSFAAIMLNTDLHNPNVKNRMSKEDWVRGNRGANNGSNFSLDFLEELYNHIKNDEIKMERDKVRFPNMVKKGWLYYYSKGKIVGQWKRKFFIITDEHLYGFKDPRQPTPSIEIPLKDLLVSTLSSEVKGRRNCFKLSQDTANLVVPKLQPPSKRFLSPSTTRKAQRANASPVKPLHSLSSHISTLSPLPSPSPSPSPSPILMRPDSAGQKLIQVPSQDLSALHIFSGSSEKDVKSWCTFLDRFMVHTPAVPSTLHRSASAFAYL